MAQLRKNEADVWYLADDWHIEDVLSIRPDLTDDQAVAVLQFLEDEFDANNGINWDVIEYSAEYCFPKENDDE